MVETNLEAHRRSSHADVESDDVPLSSSRHSGYECEAQSPSHSLRMSKKNSAIMSRISIFDNDNKPLHLPVKMGSPVITAKKLRNHREASYSPHPNSPHVGKTRTRSIPAPPLNDDDAMFSSSDHPPETSKIYEGPLVDEPSRYQPVRKSSVHERLMMFERRNKETLGLTTQSAHVRRNHSDGVFSMLSPRHTPKASINVKSTDPALFASPGVNRRKKSTKTTKERSQSEVESPTIRKAQPVRRVNEVADGPSLDHAHSYHGFSQPSNFDSPSTPSQKRSWKAKMPVVQDIPSISCHSAASTTTNRSDDSGEFASATFELLPKRSWKVKRQVSIESTASTIHEVGDDEPGIRRTPTRTDESASTHNNVEQVKNMTIYLDQVPKENDRNTTKELPTGINNSSFHEVNDEQLSESKFEKLTSPFMESAANSPSRKANKLQDRIKMFNKATSPQPAFLNSQYVDKLVQKSTKRHSTSDSSNFESKIPETTCTKQEEKRIESRMTDESARISLDKAAENEKNDTETNTKKNFERRGKLKATKSALIGQKDKDKNAVFANLPVREEDLSTYVLPEIPKDTGDKKIIITALRKNFVFEDIEENDLEKIVTAMDEIKVCRHAEIIKQGDEGDYFYVVGKGEVSFLVDGRKVGVAGPGNAFGDLALLYKCPRAATVRAETEPTRLFRIDQTTFRYMTQSQLKKSEEQKRKLLKEIPFLSTLSAEDISRLCSVMKPVLFSTGDYIVQKGDTGSSFFIIQDGKVRLTEIFVGGTSYEDTSLGTGDYFGEDALVSNEPRAANVVALTKGSAFSIDRANVRKVLGDFASLISKAQDRQRLESMKIFRDADLASPDYDNLAKLFTDQKFSAGSYIFKKNHTVCASLYIVREGAVKISSSEKSQDEIIGVGGAFGQDQLLVDSDSGNSSECQIVARYTATALSDCVCGVLTLEDCRTIFDTTTLGDRIFSGGNSALEQKRADMRDLIQSNVKLEDLDKDRIIGEGQFGTVWLVRADPHNTRDKSKMLEFAMKVQYKEDPVRRDGAIEAIKREMTVIHQLNHPFIIDLVDKYETEDQLMMLTEAVKGGELWSRIHREDGHGNWESGMSEGDAKFYALVIADTVAYMHRQKIIFRDLKPENVLIDAEGYPTLCDFGFAKYCPDKTFTFCGTPNYLAPEIVLNRGHGAAVDHWALGIVTYEMITGENPFYFEGQDQMALLQAIVQEAFYPLPNSVSKALVSLMSGLLEKDPVQRLGSLASGEKGILKHEWFSELDINQVRNKKAKAPYIPNL